MDIPLFIRVTSANTKFYLQVRRTGKKNLAADDLKQSGIDCVELDLESEAPLPDAFITPLPLPCLHEFFEQTRPFDTIHALLPPQGENLHDAFGVADLIYAYLHLSMDEGLTGLLCKTPWRYRDMDADNGEVLRLQTKEHDWRAELLFDTMNTSIPHLSIVLCDASPLQADALSFAEIVCISILTLSRFRREAYRCHRIIPITIISLSGLHARVVHGYVDVAKDKLKVFKSPILDLHKPDYKREMEMLVSWCAGTPTGSTLWNTV